MTKILGNELLRGEIWEVDPCANNYRYKSILRYITVLFESQKADVSDVLEVGLWHEYILLFTANSTVTNYSSQSFCLWSIKDYKYWSSSILYSI